MKRILLAGTFTLTLTLALNSQIPCEDGVAGVYPCDKVDLMSQMDLVEGGGGANFNDCWGWTDPNSGREFALLGRSTGTSFIEITDAVNPVLIGRLPSFIDGDNLWRDIKVYQDHAFIVSEHGGHGMQIFDLSLLLNVSEPPVNFVATAHYDGFGNAHNIAINEDSGYAYAVGTDTFGGGLHIVDITNPVNPEIAGGFEEAGYTHDAQIVIYKGPDPDYFNKEIAFACNGGLLAMVDCTDKTDCQLISLGFFEQVGYLHQGWLTPDHNYFICDDELDETQFGFNTRTHVFDTSDLDEPVYVGYFEHSTPSSDHNLYTLDHLAFMSNYGAGLRVMDVSGVATAELNEIAYFDISPGSDDAGFFGTWSNYPYFESGNVIISGFDGFWVVRPHDEVWVGVEEHKEIGNIEAWPNPAEDAINLRIEGITSSVSIRITDLSGRIVRRFNQLPTISGVLTLNTSSLPEGYYVLSVEDLNRSIPFVKSMK